MVWVEPATKHTNLLRFLEASNEETSGYYRADV